MEKFVNDVIFRLSPKLSGDFLEVVRNALYITMQDYEIIQKTYELAVPEELPKEAKIYFVSRKIDGLSEKSLKQYQRTVEKFFEIVHKPVTEVKTEDCRLFFYLRQTNSKMSKRSLENQRANLNAFFTWLTDNEYIPRNPCKAIKPFKYEEKQKKELSNMELEQLRKACRDDLDRAIIEVLYSTACRVSELVDIRLDDIDMTNGEVTIRHGKGDKSRTTYLNSRAILTIQDYIKDRDYETTWLFENYRKPHEQLCPRTIERRTKDLEIRTGIKLHPHKIRRTTATHLREKGMPIEEIQMLLGHEDINTTMIYTNVNNKSVKADHNKLLS